MADQVEHVNVLCVGDLIGRPGRRVVRELLPGLVSKYGIHFVVANGENASGGFGLMPDTAVELAKMGVHIITTGNHVWDKKEIIPFLDRSETVLRPANFPPGVPGRGWALGTASNGVRVGVVNVQGRVFMESLDCPFRAAREALRSLRDDTRVLVVDFHAEATSEKNALGWYLDGEASVVFGTHTHVQTADERVLPGGTAYMTDLGMTGSHDSVIGMEKSSSIARFVKGMPEKFAPSKKGLRFNGLRVRIRVDSGVAVEIERLNLPFSGDE